MEIEKIKLAFEEIGFLAEEIEYTMMTRSITLKDKNGTRLKIIEDGLSSFDSLELEINKDITEIALLIRDKIIEK